MAWSTATGLLRHYREDLLLGGLVLSLAAAVMAEAMPPERSATSTIVRTHFAPKLDTRAVSAARPAQQWQDTVLGRPLFALDRRPLQIAGTSDDTMPRLSGTMRFANTAFAIFDVPAAHGESGSSPDKSVVLGIGAEIGGWTIQTVMDERVLLSKAGEVRSLDLAFSRVPPPQRLASTIRVLHGKRTNVFFQP